MSGFWSHVDPGSAGWWFLDTSQFNGPDEAYVGPVFLDWDDDVLRVTRHCVFLGREAPALLGRAVVDIEGVWMQAPRWED